MSDSSPEFCINLLADPAIYLEAAFWQARKERGLTPFPAFLLIRLAISGCRKLVQQMSC